MKVTMWTEDDWNKFDRGMPFPAAMEWFEDYHGCPLTVHNYEEYKVWYIKTFTKLGQALK